MTEGRAGDGDPGLPEAGQRWGRGAQSVLPYLTKTLQSRPAASADAREAHASERPGSATDRRPAG